MSDNSSNTTYGGIGFTGLLTILFIALKLTHFINWSWVWVLAPLWISPLIAFGIVLLVCLILLLKGRK